MKLLIISLLFMLSEMSVIACPDSLEHAFLLHLTENKLWTERLAYTEQKAKDTCSEWKLEHAFSLSKLENFNAADSIYKTIKNPGKFEKHSIWIAFKTKNLDRLKEQIQGNSEAIYCLNLLTENKDTLLNKQGYNRLNNRYNEWRAVEKKSEFLAGFLSLIPGMGKLYCGYRKQAFMSMVVNTGLGLMTVEALLKRGPQDAVFYAFAGLAATFWMGSVYGTVQSLQKEKKDRLDALYLEITDRFLATYAVYPN
jgi:hypothetical protein